MGIEVAITDLEGNAARQLLLFAQIESEHIDHTDQRSAKDIHIDGILLKGIFFGHGLLLPKRQHQGIIEPIGFTPDVDSVFPEDLLHGEHFHLL